MQEDVQPLPRLVTAGEHETLLTPAGVGVRRNEHTVGDDVIVAGQPARPEVVAEHTTLDAAMARHIEAALTKTRGRIEGPFGAAAILRINPHTLRARMRKLKIDWRRFRLTTERG